MADAPKRLTAEQLAHFELHAQDPGADYAEWSHREVRTLLSHIAAQAARIAALEKAGDALVDLPIDRDAPKQQGLMVHRCLGCGTSWTPATAPRHHKEFHVGACPVPAWRAVREIADG